MNAGTVLESWERTIQQSNRALRAWLNRNKWVLGGALLLAMGLYYPIFQHGLENLDSFCTAEPYWADLWEKIPYWETTQGRWALRWSDALLDGMHPYFLTVLLASTFFLLGAVLLCDLLEVRNTWIRFALGSLVVCSQYVMNIQTYRYCSVAYAISFFLAVWAVSLASRASKGGVLAGTFCLMISLGLYQCSLGVAAVICLFLVYKTMLQQGAFNTHCRNLLVRLLVMGGVGSLLYLAVLQILLKVYHVSLADINGINQVGIGILTQIPQGVVQAYRDFFQYFFGREISQNYYSIRPLHAILLFAAGVVWLYQLVRHRKSPSFCVGSFLCMLFVPAAANVTDIINPNTQILLRMAGGMAVIPLFCFALVAQGIQLWRGTLQKVGILALALVLLRGYMLQSNNDIQVLAADKTQAVTLGNAIVAQLADREEYQQGMPVAILGRPKVVESEYRNKSNLQIRYGIFWPDAENNWDAWKRLMDQELGAKISWCGYEQAEALWEDEDFRNMPGFPKEGSIAVLDGVLVVKVT